MANEGANTHDVAFRPPLAVDLFNIAGNSQYENIIQQYRGADTLAAILGPLIASGSEGVESALQRFSNHKETDLRRAFKDVPPYLRDLIFACSTKYVRNPGCFIPLVEALISEWPHDVLFIVLNYDDLLERAITWLYRSQRFTHLDDYIAEGRRAKVVKLHG